MIKNKSSGEIIAEFKEAKTIKEEVELAIKNKISLSKADLSWADLSWVDFTKADLSGANLSWADLSWADLSRADLCGANLSKITLCNCKFFNTIISYRNKKAKVNLEEVE